MSHPLSNNYPNRNVLSHGRLESFPFCSTTRELQCVPTVYLSCAIEPPGRLFRPLYLSLLLSSRERKSEFAAGSSHSCLFFLFRHFTVTLRRDEETRGYGYAKILGWRVSRQRFASLSFSNIKNGPTYKVEFQIFLFVLHTFSVQF